MQRQDQCSMSQFYLTWSFNWCNCAGN